MIVTSISNYPSTTRLGRAGDGGSQGRGRRDVPGAHHLGEKRRNHEKVREFSVVYAVLILSPEKPLACKRRGVRGGREPGGADTQGGPREAPEPGPACRGRVGQSRGAEKAGPGQQGVSGQHQRMMSEF